MDGPVSPDEYIPFRATETPSAEPARPRPGKPSTSSSTLIALMPLLSLAFIVGLAVATTGYTTWATIATVTVVAAVLSTALANEDQRVLSQRHFVQRTRPVWALLPIVYLFVRGNRAYRESGEGMGSAWAHLAALLVVAGGIIAFSVIVSVLRELAKLLATRLEVG